MALTRSPSQSAAPAQQQDKSQEYQGMDLTDAAMAFGGLLNPQIAMGLNMLAGNDMVRELMYGPKSNNPNDLLRSRGPLDGVTEEDAAQAYAGLNAMSPEDKAAALDGLDDVAFQNLLQSMPADEQFALESLIPAASDPDRRLQLWATSAKARARADLESDDPVKQATAASTLREIDDEMYQMRFEREHGRDPSLAKVDGLIERKNLERDLEANHGVNLTNTPFSDSLDRLLGRGHADQRETWGATELEELDAGLSRMSPGSLGASGVRELAKVHEDDTGLSVIDGRAAIGNGERPGNAAGGAMEHIGAAVYDSQAHTLRDYNRGEFAASYRQRALAPDLSREALLLSPDQRAHAAHEAMEASQARLRAMGAGGQADVDALNAQEDELRQRAARSDIAIDENLKAQQLWSFLSGMFQEPAAEQGE